MPSEPAPVALSKPAIGAEEERAVIEVLRSGHLASGPRVRAFEEAFAKAHDARFAVATANGTLALELALRAMGVERGDEVIVPAFTFVATANIVLALGARPVFADIDPDSFNLDPEEVGRLLTPRTKAIIPVHLYGNPADITRIQAAAPGVPILEDAAQAQGARHKGRPIGGLGAASGFSFYPTKNMTTGEGGMILSNDAAVADLARSAVNHGRGAVAALGTYDHVRWGTNGRLTDIGAAIGLVQLGKLEAWNATRRANAMHLSEGLRGHVLTPVERAGDTHVFHQYTIRVPAPKRDRIAAHLKAHGIGFGIYYPKVLYQYPHLAEFSRKCPEAERAVGEVLSLPVHPQLTAAELDRVIAAVRAAVASEGVAGVGGRRI
ncbi:MAG: DegT/DnrJ/EryC1/StrS family aminotransferase [Thermoplasmatota archaeon]